MSRSEPTCPCGQPVLGATLCADCEHRLQVALVNIAAHHADMDTLRAKQVRYGLPTSQSRSAETPLGMDLRFDECGVGSEVEHDTRNTVTTWARELLEQHPPVPGPACRACTHASCTQVRRRRHPADTVPACCMYLLGWTGHIRTHIDGPQMLDELVDLENRLRRLVDRPPDRWYAGPCGAQVSEGAQDATGADLSHTQPVSGGECRADLYARSDRGTVDCVACGAEHDVATRRDWLLTYAENCNATATEIARAVVVFSDYDRGETRLVDRIRRWAERRRIGTRGHITVGGRARAMYRVGDVLDLLAEDARHAQRDGRRPSPDVGAA